MNDNLNVRKGRKKGEWSVYKYNCPLFTGLKSKKFALEVMRNQRKCERELRKK